MQLRIIIALLVLAPFAAWSQKPAPPTGLAVEESTNVANQQVSGAKDTVANPTNDPVRGAQDVVADGLKDTRPTGTIDGTPAICPPELTGRNATAGATKITAGFDGEAYIRAEFANGEVRGVTPSTTRVWYPDDRTWYCRAQTLAMQETPAGTPPDLPADPMKGRRWLERHNENLLGLISLFADQNVLAAIDAEEQKKAGSDLFEQIKFRTGILRTYIKAGL